VFRSLTGGVPALNAGGSGGSFGDSDRRNPDTTPGDRAEGLLPPRGKRAGHARAQLPHEVAQLGLLAAQARLLYREARQPSALPRRERLRRHPHPLLREAGCVRQGVPRAAAVISIEHPVGSSAERLCRYSYSQAKLSGVLRSIS
jgi:hypothetical protein